MKRLRLGIVVLVLCIVGLAAFAPRAAFAVDVLNQCTGSSTECTVCNNPDATSKPAICSDNQSGSSQNPLLGPTGVVTAAVKILSIVVGVVAVIVILISALRMVISTGDPTSAAGAQKSLMYALVGLAVAALAQAIEAFILSKVK